MEAGHGQIAPDRMEYLLFQGEEYLRTLGLLWKRIDNDIEQALGLSLNHVITPEVLFEDAMEFSTGFGEIYSCLHNLEIQFRKAVKKHKRVFMERLVWRLRQCRVARTQQTENMPRAGRGRPRQALSREQIENL